MLLVLDNCEHLIEACANLAETLLRSCPELRVLATSREALGIVGEVAWPVPSLSLPDLRRLPDVESLPQYESACLFVERAVAVKPDFALTEQNAATVAQVCYRLDGIPLALELAAARTKVLPVEQIADRLDDCFGLLADGSRTAMPRHKTLHATMDWSHELLGAEERALFRRLSVFAGGFSLEAAEPSARAKASKRTKCWGCSRTWWTSLWWWRGKKMGRHDTACWRRCGSTGGRSSTSPGEQVQAAARRVTTWRWLKRPSRS